MKGVVFFITNFMVTELFSQTVNCSVLFRCGTAGLQIRDGGTQSSPELGTFCRNRPPTQKSTDNTMYVKYYTNALPNPNPGFFAKASIGEGLISHHNNNYCYSRAHIMPIF